MSNNNNDYIDNIVDNINNNVNNNELKRRLIEAKANSDARYGYVRDMNLKRLRRMKFDNIDEYRRILREEYNIIEKE